MLAAMIISQMLPSGVAVKGGMGIKLRMGESGTRATADLDVFSADRSDLLTEDFATRLREGWGSVPASKGARKKDPEAPDRVAFTGSLKRLPEHDPGLAKPQYLMHPFKVTLDFLGKPWSSLDVEVADPEVGETASHSRSVDAELVELNEYFGFGDLQPVLLIDLEFQIAQKIHALTFVGDERPQDLVDLQLLWTAAPDTNKLRTYCERTFAFRRAQPWPPVQLRPMDGWGERYRLARDETVVDGRSPVLDDLEAARGWLTERINETEASSTP